MSEPSPEELELAIQLAEKLIKGMRKRSLIQLKFALAMLDEGATGTLMATVVEPRLTEFVFIPESDATEFHYGWSSIQEGTKGGKNSRQPRGGSR